VPATAVRNAWCRWNRRSIRRVRSGSEAGAEGIR
jgi:hypothetical protein